MNKYFDEAGIQRASVYRLRHTFGTHMAKKGTDLRGVQEAMGHKHLKISSLYVDLTREQTNKEMQVENAL